MMCTKPIGTKFYVQKVGQTIFKSIDCKFSVFVEAVELMQNDINVFLSEN